MAAMSEGNGAKAVTIQGDVNGGWIISGDRNIVFKIENFIVNDYPAPQQSVMMQYLKEFIEDWQKGQLGKGTGPSQETVDQLFPLASAFIWKTLGPCEKELNTTLQAVAASRDVVILRDLDIKLRIAQAEIAARGQSVIATSQTAGELMEHLSKLVKEDQDNLSINKLSLNLSLPDIEARCIIQVEIAYRMAYRLNVAIKNLAGETLRFPASFTLFQKDMRKQEVCQYTTWRGAGVQIPEIEPGLYTLQIISKGTPQLLWKMDLDLSSETDYLM